MLHFFMEEIKKLSLQLIALQKYDWLKKILHVIESSGISDDAADAQYLLVSMQIDYCKAVGKKKELKLSYLRQDQVQEAVVKQQQALRRYVGPLIRFTAELQKEREEIIARKEMLVTMTGTDPLTGLLNRYGANMHLDEAFETAYNKQSFLGIVYLDVDGLKAVNDAQGHLEGDRYIANLGEVLKAASEKEGFIASRFGGDEFVLIFEGKSDAEIHEIVAGLRQISSTRFSAGFYNAVPRGKQRSWDFLEFADMELYKEKKQKKKSG